jgi:hypothetical protein
MHTTVAIALRVSRRGGVVLDAGLRPSSPSIKRPMARSVLA